MISIQAPHAGCDSYTGDVAAHTSAFQSTRPLRGATRVKKLTHINKHISIHAPLAGCDVKQPIIDILIAISIHAPLAGCDFPDLYPVFEPLEISIHAPLAGCDAFRARLRELGIENFNPRAPCGVRRHQQRDHARRRYFNPRAPCGVRHIDRADVADAVVISIHAPLAGCDLPVVRILCPMRRHFNPRAPCGVRLRFAAIPTACFRISIHAPLAGCDCGFIQKNKQISNIPLYIFYTAAN